MYYYLMGGDQVGTGRPCDPLGLEDASSTSKMKSKPSKGTSSLGRLLNVLSKSFGRSKRPGFGPRGRLPVHCA